VHACGRVGLAYSLWGLSYKLLLWQPSVCTQLTHPPPPLPPFLYTLREKPWRSWEERFPWLLVGEGDTSPLCLTSFPLIGELVSKELKSGRTHVHFAICSASGRLAVRPCPLRCMCITNLVESASCKTIANRYFTWSHFGYTEYAYEHILDTYSSNLTLFIHNHCWSNAPCCCPTVSAGEYSEGKLYCILHSI